MRSLPLFILVAFTGVTVSLSAQSPTAIAGPRQSAAPGTAVTLDGSRSTDISGGPLQYHWSLLSVPASSETRLLNADRVTASLTPDREGDYVAQLIVCHSNHCGAPATTRISTGDLPPIADAGRRQSVPPGSLVALDGSHSTGPKGQSLSYRWSLQDKPAGSAATLTNPESSSPSFTADIDGVYVAQLTVTSGSGLTASTTVTIGTNCQAPLAFAGRPPDDTPRKKQDIALAKPFLLQGGASSALCGNNLTYHWSLLSTPPGSLAQLSDPLSQSPSLTPDVRGDYVAQLIVGDGAHQSEPDTVHLTMSSGPSISLPANVTVTSVDPQYYPVLLSEPAPSSGLTVTLAVADPTVVAIFPSTVTFASGATTLDQNPLIQSIGLGATTVTASAPGFASDTETVTQDQQCAFYPSAIQLKTGATTSPFLSCYGSAPSFFSFAVPVDLTSSDVSVASVPPSVLSYDPENAAQTETNNTASPVPVQAGPNPGTATLTAAGNGVTTTTAPVTVSKLQPALLSCSIPYIGFNLEILCTVSLSPGPSSGASVSGDISSLDPAKILLAGDRSQVGGQTLPFTLTYNSISVFTYSYSFWVQGLAASGSAEIAAAIPGYAPSTVTLSFVPSGFYFGNPSFFFSQSAAPQLIYLYENPSGVPYFFGQSLLQPGVSPPLKIVSSNPAVGVVGNALTYVASQYGWFATFTPLGPGTTILTIEEPPGYTGASIFPGGQTTASVTVTGKNLTFQCGQAFGPTQTCAVTPDSSITVPPGTMSTITTSNPNVRFNGNLTTLQVAPNQTFNLDYTGVPGGSASFTVSTPGFATTTQTLSFSLTTLILTVAENSDNPQALTSAKQGNSITMRVDTPFYAPIGSSTPIALTNSDPSVGTVPASVNLVGTGATSTGVQFQFNALSPGTTRITASSPGFIGAAITITVIAEGHFTFSCANLALGYHLYAPCTATLSSPAPAAGLTVALVNYASFLQISESPGLATNLGPNTLNLSFPQGATTQTFYVANLGGTTGSEGFTASAPGYNLGGPSITLVPSGFSFGEASTTAGVSDGQVSYPIYATAIVGGKAGPRQTLLPGVGNQSLYIANLRGAVGQPHNPVIFQQGTASTSVLFTPIAKGTDILCITQPSGFIESKDLNELTISVTNP